MTILGDKNIKITSSFGERIHPITGKKKFHRGIDLGCPIGTKVYSPVGGIVKFVRHNSPSAGNYLFIQDNLTDDNYEFMHLSEILVAKNDIIQAGELIALSGNTGNSTGPHLHFGRFKNPKYEDNGYVFPQNEEPIDPTDKIEITF